MKIEKEQAYKNGYEGLFPEVSKRLIIPSTEIEHYGFNQEQIQREFDFAGIDPENLYSVHLMQTENGYIPAHYEVDFQSEDGRQNLLAQVALEVLFTDGKQRAWESRIFVFPEALAVDGKEIPLPPMVDDIGYQILVNRPQADSNAYPLFRIDSVCTMSMFDGHYASGGDINLGCDCAPQRECAQQLILDHDGGGCSILSPLAGRGNGTPIHSGQIAIQNFCKRYDLPIPPTYDTHEGQGASKDCRPQFYFMDALLVKAIMRKTFNGNKIGLFTNNPDKISAIQYMGLEVIPHALHVPERQLYYQGFNFRQKVEDGGHKAFIHNYE